MTGGKHDAPRKGWAEFGRVDYDPNARPGLGAVAILAFDTEADRDAYLALADDRDRLREALKGLLPFVIIGCLDQRGWARCRACGFRWSIADHPDGVHSETCATIPPAALLTTTAPAGDTEP